MLCFSDTCRCGYHHVIKKRVNTIILKLVKMRCFSLKKSKIIEPVQMEKENATNKKDVFWIVGQNILYNLYKNAVYKM